LIKERLAIPADVRRRHGAQIAASLEKAIGSMTGVIISAYWPFRGEPDLRPFLERVAAGGRTALPVVIARGQPPCLRASDDPLERGVWNIPVPASDAEVVVPDVVIAPVVGFDSACYRLGYGGGFLRR
jgi:5-formyltetrahydrofolate cyclo-ligase